jgi:pimeloyl-ACP methyl ester carboxylesterase
VQVLQTAAECTGDDMPDGLIVHSPGYALMFKEAAFLRGLSYGAFAWLRVPWVRLTEILKMPMTDDKAWENRWKHSKDRLRQGIKVRYFINAADMGIAARNSSPHLTIPILAMWGGKDRMGLGGNEKLRAEYDHYMRHELAGGGATQFYREDGFHLLTEGTTKSEAIQEVLRWVEANVK